jgi:hypothetical protein
MEPALVVVERRFDIVVVPVAARSDVQMVEVVFVYRKAADIGRSSVADGISAAIEVGMLSQAPVTEDSCMLDSSSVQAVEN